VPRLTRELLKWSLHERGTTAAWVNKQKHSLAWWMARLKGVDPRRATLRDHISPALDRTGDKAPRVRVIKAFYGWLRKERHALTYAEGPTLDLRAPPSKPAQRVKSKVVPREHYLLVRDALTAPWRDALTVQAAGTRPRSSGSPRQARSSPSPSR
jgi:hypothetical protein